jgi:putative Ca2+/H+ antiporter (TMEM165/GDT1 family)
MAVIGSTLGVLLADLPAVLIGCKVEGRFRVKVVRTAGAVILALLGIATFVAAVRGSSVSVG